MMKKIIYCLLCIVTFITCITNAHAAASWNVGSGIASTEDADIDKPENKEPTPLGDPITEGNKTKTYGCLYETKVTNETRYDVSIYDEEDQEILNSNFTINQEKLPLAGTAIGINIKETKTISWEVTKVELSVTETERTNIPQYKCEYIDRRQPITLPDIELLASIMTFSKIQQIAVRCSSHNYTVTGNTACNTYPLCNVTRTPDGYQSGTNTRIYTLDLNSRITNQNDQTKFQECKNNAVTAAVNKANGNITASYSLEMTDSNDIKGNDSIKITKEDANNTAVFKDKLGNKMNCRNQNECKFTVPTDNTLSDKRTIEMFYKKDRTCINVKTARVTYKSNDEKCDSPNEMEIANTTVGGLEHWHYFIPLNAKSTDQIKIKMSPGSNEILTADKCLYVMRHNQIDSGKISYVELIKPVATGEEFKGNYTCISNNCDPNTGDFNEFASDYTEINQNGCILTSNASIYSKQEFYNEVATGNNQVKFNGFNFYYKPIDPNNENVVNIIFPNGVTTNQNGDLTFNSLWSDWYKRETTNGNASPDLSKSYSEITYIAQNINVSAVREYNQSYAYTDWTDMSINGTSNFIDSKGIIERANNLATDVYKLGCGPANITTQEGCGIK